MPTRKEKMNRALNIHPPFRCRIGYDNIKIVAQSCYLCKAKPPLCHQERFSDTSEDDKKNFYKQKHCTIFGNSLQAEFLFRLAVIFMPQTAARGKRKDDNMPKHRKRMKLPNNFGSIKYLGKGRRRPYGVYPPVTEYSFHGPVSPKALAYTETWEEGYEILTAYNMEKSGKIKVNYGTFIDRTPTFSEVYDRFFHEKF